MNLDEARKLMNRLNHGDAGVGRADHVNLQDGLIEDCDGSPLAMGEDTKIPLAPSNPLGEPDVYDVPLELPEVGQETVDFWRDAQRRGDTDDDEHT